MYGSAVGEGMMKGLRTEGVLMKTGAQAASWRVGRPQGHKEHAMQPLVAEAC